MSDRLRFGVIGCGEIAAETCQGMAASPHTAIAMLMDLRPEVSRDLADFFGVPSTTDVDQVLASPEVDAVYIATPHDTHVSLGIRAAQAGKHVLIEKPIATDLAGADALIAACRAGGVSLGVAFYAQVDASLAAARQIVRAGVLGEIIAVRLSCLADKPETYWHGGYTQRVQTDWRTSKVRAGGGVLMMNVIHDLNTVRWVTGLEVHRVYAEYGTLATPVDVEDTIAVVLRYDNHGIGMIQAGSALRGGEHQDARGPRIYGTRGQMILDSRPSIYLQEPWEGMSLGDWGRVPFSGPTADREQIVSRFATAVLAGEPPPCTGEDGRAALEIVLAAYRSGELGRPTELPLQS